MNNSDYKESTYFHTDHCRFYYSQLLSCEARRRSQTGLFSSRARKKAAGDFGLTYSSQTETSTLLSQALTIRLSKSPNHDSPVISHPVIIMASILNNFLDCGLPPQLQRRGLSGQAFWTEHQMTFLAFGAENLDVNSWGRWLLSCQVR